jgi:hypothetical protein
LLLVEKGNNQACGVLDLGGAPLTRIGIVTSAGDKVRTLRQGREVVVVDKPFRHFG